MQLSEFKKQEGVYTFFCGIIFHLLVYFFNDLVWYLSTAQPGSHFFSAAQNAWTKNSCIFFIANIN